MTAGEMKHTATPWAVDDVNTTFVAKLVDGVYHYICRVEPSDFSTDSPSREENEANAAFIVQAVNAHDDLVAALTFIETMIEGRQITTEQRERYVKDGRISLGEIARAVIAKASP